MATTAEEELLKKLDAAGMAYTVYRHAPVSTVPEAREAEATCGLDRVDAVRTKNLFITDNKKARKWLLTAAVDSRVDMKKLGVLLMAPGLKFAHDLTEALGLEPGSATPFGIVNDQGPTPKVVSLLDEAVLQAELALVHPMHNAATVSVRPEDIAKFLAAHAHEAFVLRFHKDGGCEIVSEPTSGSGVMLAAAAAAADASKGAAGKGKAQPQAGSATSAAGGTVLSTRLEGLMLDDLVAAVKGGELTSADDEQLRARLSALLTPHFAGLRNTAYVAGYGARLTSVPKNPILDL